MKIISRNSTFFSLLLSAIIAFIHCNYNVQPNSSTLWVRALYDGMCDNIQHTYDGGFVLVGHVSGSGGKLNIYLTKISPYGNQLWEKEISSSDFNEYPNFVKQTSDGGYIISGTKKQSEYAIYLIKTDSKGNVIWRNNFNKYKHSYSYGVINNSDGGYTIVGSTKPTNDSSHIYLIKADSKGCEKWNQTFYGSQYNIGRCVQQTTDGGYIIVGDTGSYPSNEYDIWLIKTDSDGNKNWIKTYGNQGIEERGYYVRQTFDGGYIITGSIENINNLYSYLYLLKTDSNGEIVWEKSFDELSIGYYVYQTQDSGYLISGPGISAMKTDPNGEQYWYKIFKIANNNCASYLQPTSDDCFLLMGKCNLGPTPDDPDNDKWCTMLIKIRLDY